MKTFIANYFIKGNLQTEMGFCTPEKAQERIQMIESIRDPGPWTYGYYSVTLTDILNLTHEIVVSKKEAA